MTSLERQSEGLGTAEEVLARTSSQRQALNLSYQRTWWTARTSVSPTAEIVPMTIHDPRQSGIVIFVQSYHGPNRVPSKAYMWRSDVLYFRRRLNLEMGSLPHRPRKEPTLKTTWPQTCSLQNCEKVIFWGSRGPLPICGILLRQIYTFIFRKERKIEVYLVLVSSTMRTHSGSEVSDASAEEVLPPAWVRPPPSFPFHEKAEDRRVGDWPKSVSSVQKRLRRTNRSRILEWMSNGKVWPCSFLILGNQIWPWPWGFGQVKLDGKWFSRVYVGSIQRDTIAHETDATALILQGSDWARRPEGGSDPPKVSLLSVGDRVWRQDHRTHVFAVSIAPLASPALRGCPCICSVWRGCGWTKSVNNPGVGWEGGALGRCSAWALGQCPHSTSLLKLLPRFSGFTRVPTKGKDARECCGRFWLH